MDIAPDFLSLLPRLAVERDERPTYYLWVFDPYEGRVHLEHNEGRHRAETVDHPALAERVRQHPDREHGYAYPIRGGWRITNRDHRPVDDPFVLRQVEKALKGEKSQHQASQIALRAVQ